MHPFLEETVKEKEEKKELKNANDTTSLDSRHDTIVPKRTFQ
jgi:hypothetical protein